MKKFLITLLLMFTLGCHRAPKAPEVKSPIERQHASTHRIGVHSTLGALDDLSPTAHCSATAVGPHALLTAQHCFMNSNTIKLDGSPTFNVKILAVMPDGNDHVIYIVNYTFQDFSPITQRSLLPGEKIHFWGNPGHLKDTYRDGTFTGMHYEPDLDFNLQTFLLPTYGGDSGSALFDKDGKIVAVVSLGATREPGEMSLPLQFTKGQLKAVQ